MLGNYCILLGLINKYRCRDVLGRGIPGWREGWEQEKTWRSTQQVLWTWGRKMPALHRVTGRGSKGKEKYSCL